MAQSPDSDWAFVFVPWFEIEDYNLSLNEDVRNRFLDGMGNHKLLSGDLDVDEGILYHQGVSVEQLYWRRKKIDEEYKGDIDSFRQQYPATADEAFLTSGRPVFSAAKVKEKLSRSFRPMMVGNLVWKDTKTRVEFVEEQHGYWELYEERVTTKENLYCLGADVSEGIAVQPEFGNKGGDFSCAKVFQRDNRRFVARLHERLDPDVFAGELHKAWAYWGCGLLVENNPGGSGNVVIRDLKDIPGINLLKTVTLDKIHDVRKEQYGWDTNQQSKREMIDELVEHIRDENFTDPSKNFWYEASTYIRDEKGKTNAQSRKYDDEVIANALAIQANKLMSAYYKPVVEEVKTYTKDMDIKENWVNPITQEQVMEDNYSYF